MNFVIIDTSYLIFYRYYALLQWWSHAKPDIELPEDPYECQEFVEKFNKMIFESIENIKKKLKINKKTCQTKVIAARDCPRAEIWRNKLYADYKISRDKEDTFTGGAFFKHVYNNDCELLKKAGANEILQFPNLEGDDIIAIIKSIIRKKYPDSAIYIIANDHDYLQLLDDKTDIINLQFKSLRENKKVFPEADKNLFFKILLGDKSDCITPVFSKCGPKTAEKYYENPAELEKALTLDKDKDGGARMRFERNKKLVSFTEIPLDLVQNFIEQNQASITNL